MTNLRGCPESTKIHEFKDYNGLEDSSRLTGNVSLKNIKIGVSIYS